MGWRTIVVALILTGCAAENSPGGDTAISLTMGEVTPQSLAGRATAAYACPPDPGGRHLVHITGVSSGDAGDLTFDLEGMMDTCAMGESRDAKSCQGMMMMGNEMENFTLTNTTADRIFYNLQVVVR